MKNICNEFISGLEKKYQNSDEILKNEYNSFIERKKGISSDELNNLLKEYPDIPESLIDLLKYSNGTDIYCFQSDVDDGKYPYYLTSSSEMIKCKDDVKTYYSDYIERYFDDCEIDNKISNNIDNIKWLLFSNCMNNGGTSQLFIDFTPSKEGKVGQIVRYLHDPDSMTVIADSFDEFLKQIIDSNYKFIDGEIESNELLKKQAIVETIVETKVKEKNILAAIFVSLFGILGIVFGISVVKTNIFGCVFMLLFGIICILASILNLKGNSKSINNRTYGGFIISKNITKNGEKIKYSYREESKIPELNGWTIYSTIDDEEYIRNSDNFEIINATTIYKIAPIMLNIFEAPYGTNLQWIYNENEPVTFYDIKSNKKVSIDDILKK